MTQHPFYRLAPFIQEYIYRKGWAELRPIQVQAIQSILDTDHHLLLSSGTASGKTEAALLPILTQLEARPSASIGVLYIGPLKALINDQFERLQGLLEETNVPVQSWHGDVSHSKKSRFLQKAQGILQITPESLEAMLINRPNELRRLFGDLRFVVIDEIHAFIGSDRGRQVICQLQRLARYQNTPPRRVGLSATLGEPELAMSWLAGNTGVSVHLISDTGSQRDVQLGLEHFLSRENVNASTEADADIPPQDTGLENEQTTTDPGVEDEIVADLASLSSILVNEESLYQHIYRMCESARKSLIFANQRAEVEETVASLRNIAAKKNAPDFYHVHHGSIAAPLREAAEDAMRDPERRACVAATLTLELGIDIGQLDQVLQINATHSVSSFVQRLGRSGRRGTPARMFFYSREVEPDDKAPLGELIPWDLLQTIAIVQLYVEGKWVEPPDTPYLPFSLLYHQTMSTLLAAGELSPSQLAQQVLTLAPFANVTPEYFKILLRHLIETKHLEQMETDTLIVGLEGEKIVNNYRFYATFEAERGVRVLFNSREIGTISDIPEVDTIIRLAGYTWRIASTEPEQKVVYVQRSKGKAQNRWGGSGVSIHSRVVQRVRQILREDTDYGYLQPRARQRLMHARSLARSTGLADASVLPRGSDRAMLLPWCGTKTFRTLEMVLETTDFKVSRSQRPFYLEVSGFSGTIDEFRVQLRTLASNLPDPEQMVEQMNAFNLQLNKYDQFIPNNLLQMSFVKDSMDMEQARICLHDMGLA